MSDYSKKLEDLLDHHLISNEKLIKKKKLGGVGYLINGNMCLGIYDNYLVVRIGKELADTLKVRSGIALYESDNSYLEDFIMVDPTIYMHSRALQKFIERGIKFTSKLPPKIKEDEE